jgi:hypothetical protein
MLNEDCNTAKQACLSIPDVSTVLTPSECATTLSQCTVTSADITGCLGPVMDIFNSLSCQSGLAALLAPSPEACAALQTKCPSAMPTTGLGGGSSMELDAGVDFWSLDAGYGF